MKGSGKDLTGMRFGKLVIIKRIKNTPYNYRTWMCQCDCGNTKSVVSSVLIRGDTKSCGCLRHVPNKLFKGILSLEHNLYLHYKNQAALRYIEFKLEFDDFVKIVEMRCKYCGGTNTHRHMTRRDNFYDVNGVDRLDNKKGYTVDNCVPCCKYCNYAKRDRSLDEFMDWIRQLIEFQSNKIGTEKS